jgi:hypothetical protein
VKINIAINLLYRLEPIGALIQRKARSAAYGNLFVFANGRLYFVPYEVPGSLLAFIEANQRR